MKRLENGLGWVLVFVVTGGSLLVGPRMGWVGEYLSVTMRAVAGDAAWLIPVWCADVSIRTFRGIGSPFMRVLRWALFCLLSAVSLSLLGVAGGWVGLKMSAIMLQWTGIGAYALALGTWLALMLRLLGADRVQVIAVQATSISRQAFAQARPLTRMRAAMPAHSGIIDTVSEAALASFEPPPIPMMAPGAAPYAQRSAQAVPARIVPRRPSKWSLPEVGQLQAAEERRVESAFLAKVAEALTARLRLFRLMASVQPAVEQGAIVSRYEITLGPGQEISAVTSRHKDLASHFKGLRFVELQGSGKLGVEIPIADEHRRMIVLREVLDSPAWTEADMALPLALGVTTSGEPVVVDLAECPHLLVAGTTGSGKSVGVNVMLASLLLRNSPSELNLILVDPKMVEFPRYRGLPHLARPVITEVADAIEALQWACEEMDRRYRLFVDADAEHIEVFNEAVPASDRLPRIVIVIDEYADLTSGSKSEKEQVENAVVRLAQKARAAGIHVILATQRPSVDVVTSRIKTNFGARIGYKTAQRQDSITIVNKSGAENLLGNGDSLLLIPSYDVDLTRVHGAFVSKQEVKAICASWTAQASGEERRAPPPASAAPADPAAPAEPPPTPTPKSAPTPAPKADVPASELSAPKFAPLISPNEASADRYQQAIELARSEGAASQRMFTEGLRCSTTVAKRLFSRMRDEGLIRPGGKNNTYIFCGVDAASTEE